jgi:hypothetical protein
VGGEEAECDGEGEDDAEWDEEGDFDGVADGDLAACEEEADPCGEDGGVLASGWTTAG